MRLYLLPILFIFFSAQAVSNLSVSVNDLVEKNGRYYLESQNEAFTGTADEHYSDGQLKQRETFIDGVKEGQEYTWYENGNLMSVVVYKAGKPQGYGSSWYAKSARKLENKTQFLSCTKMDKGDVVYSKLCGSGSGQQATYLEFDGLSPTSKATFLEFE